MLTENQSQLQKVLPFNEPTDIAQCQKYYFGRPGRETIGANTYSATNLIIEEIIWVTHKDPV